METSKRPLVLHEFATPNVLLWAALMIPNRLLATTLILPLLALSYYNLLQTTSPSPSASFIVGSYVMYHVFASINLLLLRDPRTEFRRLPITAGETKKNEEEEGEAYPRDLKRRIWWTFDLIVTMRGIGWSWQIRPIPPLSSTEVESRSVYLRRRFNRILIIYAWLDMAMFLVQHVDRGYFLPPGNAYEDPSVKEPVYPSLFLRSTRPQQHPVPLGLPEIPPGALGLLYRVSLYTTRHMLTGTLLYVSLNGGYTLVSLAAVLLGALLGTEDGWRRRYLHWHSWPDMFGSWSAGDWGRGTTGWWSRAWHGLFKNVFTAPARCVVRRCGLGRGSPAAAVMQLGWPFALSAAMHYGGAYTQAGGGWGSARFFLWQPVGVGIEMAVVRWCPRCVYEGEGVVQGWVRRWGPYVWANMWFVVTSGSFFEEVKYGGMWAMQPVPVSVWKWVAGVGAWCWGRETPVGWRGWWEWDESMGGWGVRI
ncbi:uncharacterized protein H6S33_012633 [Morchella sextelata]|uniref:uncharacterized protein n=1 Tax=Morchella sextelata TaxID=1174677 RepID=UPI001D03F286|nr:uncharacterized protein H6S33_012633 [Morchella sextelata]KAH0610087.1 hypothetical protein H6S33_012633 [Morchella sextelata]